MTGHQGRGLLLVLTGLLLAARPGWGEGAAEVINLEPGARVKVGDQWADARNAAVLPVGAELETRQGKLSVLFAHDRSPGQLGLAPGARVRIVEPSLRPSDAGKQIAGVEGEGLVGGGMQVALYEGEGLVSGSLDVRTGREREIEVVHQGTEFIVSYQEATGRVQVVGVSGTVLVRSPAGTVQVGANELTVVEAGGAPSPPRSISHEALAERLQVFQFIGRGEAQSQVLGYPLRLKVEDRATWLTLPMGRHERRRFADPPIDNPPAAADLSIEF